MIRTAILVILGLVLTACTDKAPTNAIAGSETAYANTAAKPAFGNWGVDLDARKQEVLPGDDFFEYANGKWLQENEIPADRSSYSLSLQVHERAQERVKAIIEELKAKGGAAGTPEQKVGDYYASYMDTETLNNLGIKPLQADIDRIRNIRDLADLTREFGRMHYVGGVSPIAQSLSIDAKNPDRYQLSIYLSGLGLPEKDYYFEDAEKFVEVRAEYLKHIERMLGYAGTKGAGAKAQEVMALETRIATNQWDRADRRNRDKTYNPIKLTELKTRHPRFDWDAYFAAGNVVNIDDVNLAHPNTLAPLISLIHEVPLTTWRAYLVHHLISNNAPLLSEEIDNADFEFYGKVLSGREQQLERWKRGVSRVGGKSGLGEALGQIYVKRHFPESSKQKVQAMVEDLRRAYGQRIDAIDWMSADTKKEARAKLAAFRAKIGYPDTWLDLSGINITSNDLLGNARRITKFFEDRDMARLDKPTDREEWFMMPQTVNAYYLSNFNEIVFPAAILEPPFFDANADDAVNYAGIGAVIGHEMGHGFDDQGSKSDARGIKRNWWTEADLVAFQARTGKLASQYSLFEALDGQFVDGQFTLGENIGDLGGVEVALLAYELSLDNKPAPVIEGFTGHQRFFLGYAQSWRGKVRDEVLLQYLKSDPHSPSRFRVNGVVRNVDSWYRAFDVKPGQALFLAPEDRVSIW